MKNIEIVLILKLNITFKMNSEINKEIENNFTSSLTFLNLSIIDEILIKIFKYFLAYFANKNNQLIRLYN